jgi:hypothetical protein
MAAIENIRSLSRAQSRPDHHSPDFRRPLTTKLHLYEAPYTLNRGFEATMLGLHRLAELGVFQGKGLDDYKVAVELTRAEANEELAATLQEYEEDDSAYWDRRRHEREKQLQDPDDVFFAARDRKQEIKEQIKTLQQGLARQSAGKRRGRSRKKRRK